MRGLQSFDTPWTSRVTEAVEQSDPPFPTDGPLLGLDYGTKRIGFAMCTPEQTMAVPLENYDRRNEAIDTKHVQALCEEYRLVGIVVGLPVHTDGTESHMSRQVREYGEKLRDATGRPLVFWDERYTSHAAEESLIAMEQSSRTWKGRVDMLAATILLQSFLDADDRTATPEIE